MTPEQFLQEKIDAMRSRFLIALTERLDGMEALREGLETAPDTIRILQEVRSSAHKTVGTASSFGFGSLGMIASQTEQVIDGYLTGSGGNLTLEHVAGAIDALLEEMTTAVIQRTPD